mgnify:CR=1 FL=1
MKIIGIEHIGIASDDLAKANKFWKVVLGIKNTHTEDIDTQGVITDIYDTGNGKIEILLSKYPNSAIAKFIRKKGRGIHHLCLSVENIDEAINELKEKYSGSKSALVLNEVNNSYCLELKSTLNEFVEDLLPSELRTSELRTLATIAIKKKILQSDLIILRGSGAYEHIRELINKKFVIKRKQKDGRSYWLSLSEKFFQTFAVSNEYLSQIGGNKK